MNTATSPGFAHGDALRAAPAAATVKSNPPQPTMAQALARLNLSRQRLQESLKPPPEEGNPGPLHKAREWLRGSSWGSVLDPILGAVGDDVMRWWGRQGWGDSALLAKNAVSAELGPLVKRYPIAAVLVTAAAGAAFASSGLWRWRAVKRGMSHLGLQLKGLGISQLSNPAVQGLVLSGLLSVLVPKRRKGEGMSTDADSRSSAPVEVPGEIRSAPAHSEASR